MTQEQYLSMVDTAAEAARARHITLAPGQALTYAAKEAEARRLLADHAAGRSPGSADYRWLTAEIGILAPVTGSEADDLLTVARIVVANADQWSAAGAAIEAQRLTAKKAIRQSTCAAEAAAIVTTLTWPQPQP